MPELVGRLDRAADRRADPAGALALFHVHRCGSQVLGRMLGEHPALDWFGEVHNVNGGALRPWWPVAGLDKGTSVPEMLPVIRDLAGSRRAVISVPSSLAAIEAVPPAEMIRRLIGAGLTHAVVLERRNLLAVLVSMSRARHEGVWHHLETDREPPLGKVELPLRSPHGGFPGLDVRESLHAMRAWYAEVRAALAPVATLNLVYEEDLEADPARGLSRVLAFLDLPDLPIRPAFRKSAAVPLCEQIENLDPVRERLTGTPDEWMLEEKQDRVPRPETS